MNIITKFTDLPTDIIIDILCICDYKSILRLNCTCKLINNIKVEIILISKSIKIKDIKNNTDHLIPRLIIFNEKSLKSYDYSLFKIFFR